MEYTTNGQDTEGRDLPPSNIDRDVRLVYDGVNENGGSCSAEEVALSLRSALLAIDSADPDFEHDHPYLPHHLPRPRLRDAVVRALGYWEARAQAELQ